MIKFAKNSGIEPVYGPNNFIDFAATFSGGEFSRYYSGRRVWRALSLLAPSFNLEPEYENLLVKNPPLPFSVKVEQKVDHLGLIAIHRDWYGVNPWWNQLTG